MRNAPPNKPIFAYVAPFVAHAGSDANGARVNGMPIAAKAVQGQSRAVPDCRTMGSAQLQRGGRQRQARLHPGPAPCPLRDGWPIVPFCEAMLAVDQEFTRIRKELTAEGRFHNTLFLLTTDNGMAYGSHRVGTKYVPYSTQMPLFAYWADGRGVSPAVVARYLQNVDVAPTLCELGGCTMGPYANGLSKPDGQSFLGLITPQSTSARTRSALYEENRGNTDGWPPWRALRTTTASRQGRWHYIENDSDSGPNTVELYDVSGGICWNWSPGMNGDPCELTNVASAHPDIVTALHAELGTFVTHVDPRIPCHHRRRARARRRALFRPPSQLQSSPRRRPRSTRQPTPSPD